MASGSRAAQGLYLIAVGIAFGGVGLIMLGDPQYWDAITAFDYAAVWAHSLALLLAAPALIILVRQAQAGKPATVVAWIVAAGALLSAAANVIEDALHLKDFGTLYVLGAVPFAYGMPVLAILLALGERKAFALVPALTFVGLLAYSAGGGILIGATWAIFGVLIMTGRTEPVAQEMPPPSASVEAA